VTVIPKPSCRNLAVAVFAATTFFSCKPSVSEASVENFGISSCSLGCNGQSFSVSQLAENQDIKFVFNDTVDPASVDTSSISIVDVGTGVQPNGTYIVDGSEVIFRPSLDQSAGGSISYGFTVSSTYRINVNASNSVSVVRSLKGRLNQSLITGEVFIEPATDLNPGPPSVVSVSPDNSELQTTNDFSILVVFDDIMQTLPLANPDTGESLLVSVSSFDNVTGVRYEMPGFFSITVDRDALTTTLAFVPSVTYPSSNAGTRNLEIAVGQEISDISNNNLSNPGPRTVLLADGVSEAVVLSEGFDDASKQDTSGSVYGLWEATSYLDSGQLDTGTHNGGGSGALGEFMPDASQEIALNTDGLTAVHSELFQAVVAVNGGVYPFTEVVLPDDNNVTATGSNPLRLFAQGDFTSYSKIILNGDSAPTHFGKAMYGSANFGEYDGDEVAQVVLESISGGAEFGGEDNLFGGDPATGGLTGGDGGAGGDSWLANSIGFSGSNYFNTQFTTWSQWVTGEAGAPSSGRYQENMGASDDRYCGENGQGVGGSPALGSPIDTPDDILTDFDNGSGMGSWAWPPRSNVMPGGAAISTHLNSGFILHRSRGGGGGGYWSAGERGLHFVDDSINGLGQNMSTLDLVPAVDDITGSYEFNATDNGSDKFSWDINATSPNQVQDASGGQFAIPAGYATLDPEQGFLRGGSGGGGGGMGQHGSIEDRTPGAVAGSVGTWRCSPGGGGGAGGGALQIFAGSNLSITGEIGAKGGNGATSVFVQSIPYFDSNVLEYGPPGDAGGGGGSGGAILLEAGRSLQLADDIILVDGGQGGRGAVGNNGGDGGSGVVRFNTATGAELLTNLEAWVSPDVAVQSDPELLNDIPNVGVIGGVNYPGTVGDVNFLTGEVINGNASGVRSMWYEPAADKSEIDIVSYSINCEYSDGSTVQTITFDQTNTTSPDEAAGLHPVWIAFQGAWLAPGDSANAKPELVLQTPWYVPGINVASNGIDEFNLNYNRGLRFMLVFDQDEIAALMNGGFGSYFRVTDVQFDVVAQ